MFATQRLRKIGGPHGRARVLQPEPRAQVRRQARARAKRALQLVHGHAAREFLDIVERQPGGKPFPLQFHLTREVYGDRVRFREGPQPAVRRHAGAAQPVDPERPLGHAHVAFEVVERQRAARRHEIDSRKRRRALDQAQVPRAVRAQKQARHGKMSVAARFQRAPRRRSQRHQVREPRAERVEMLDAAGHAPVRLAREIARDAQPGAFQNALIHNHPLLLLQPGRSREGSPQPRRVRNTQVTLHGEADIRDEGPLGAQFRVNPRLGQPGRKPQVPYRPVPEQGLAVEVRVVCAGFRQGGANNHARVLAKARDIRVERVLRVAGDQVVYLDTAAQRLARAHIHDGVRRIDVDDVHGPVVVFLLGGLRAGLPRGVPRAPLFLQAMPVLVHGPPAAGDPFECLGVMDHKPVNFALRHQHVPQRKPPKAALGDDPGRARLEIARAQRHVAPFKARPGNRAGVQRSDIEAESQLFFHGPFDDRAPVEKVRAHLHGRHERQKDPGRDGQPSPPFLVRCLRTHHDSLMGLSRSSRL